MVDAINQEAAIVLVAVRFRTAVIEPRVKQQPSADEKARAMKPEVQERPPTSYVEVTEQKRLNDARERGVPWKKWGLREDYSNDGNAWNYFSHDQSRSRAYRWGEDGLAGICDDKQQLLVVTPCNVKARRSSSSRKTNRIRTAFGDSPIPHLTSKMPFTNT